MYDRTRKILYGNKQVYNGWFFFIFILVSDRSVALGTDLNGWGRLYKNENLFKPTILTATNDINNQKTAINGEIRA